MSIVSSTIAWAHVQKDGTMNVREQFIDDQGNIYYMDFQAPVGASAIMRLAADAVTMAAYVSAAGIP